MPTGYEDYVRLQWTDPSTALARAQEHERVLMEMASGARTQADGVLYDPATLLPLLELVRKDIMRLVGEVNGYGVPTLVPTRRLDPGPVVGYGSYGETPA